MEILLNKENWKFIINTLIAVGYEHNDIVNDIEKTFEELEKVFSVEPDFKTLLFVIAEQRPETNKNIWYCYTRFIHNEDVYEGSDLAGKSHQEYLKFILG